MITIPEAGIDFVPETHRYFRDGIERPGVTQILNDFWLLPPYPDHGGHKERGTAVHRVTDMIDNGTFPPPDPDSRYPRTHPELWPYLDAYNRFRDQYGAKIKIIAIEHMIYCPRIAVCGRIDRVVDYESCLAIIDFKTGDPPDAVKLQLGGYEIGLRSMTGYKDRIRRFSLQLKPSGRFSFSECKDPLDIQAFAGLAQAWHWAKLNRARLPGQ